MILGKLRQKYSKTYANLFTQVPNDSKDKDELINVILFSLTYVVHWAFFDLFP